MIKQAIAAAGLGLAAYVAFEIYSNKKMLSANNLVSNESYFVEIKDELMQLIPATFRLNNAKKVDIEVLKNQNVQAFLQVIRKGEGTLGVNGYRTIFGGGLFDDFTDHPRILVKKGKYKSTAAGAYQFKISTWDETAKIMGLKDFTVASQDLGAIGRIAIRGALDDVIEGRFVRAIKKCCQEWASLPFSKYGQPTQSLADARQFYLINKGVDTA